MVNHSIRLCTSEKIQLNLPCSENSLVVLEPLRKPAGALGPSKRIPELYIAHLFLYFTGSCVAHLIH